MRFIIMFLLLACGFFASTINISDSTISNGRTVFVELDNTELQYKSAKIGKKEFKLLKFPHAKNKSYLLIPISYYAKPQTEKLVLHYTQNQKLKEKQVFLKVVDGKYEKEKIQVNKSKVNPNKKDAKRASKEYHESMKVYNTFTNKSYVNSAYIYPIESKITSDFGKARVYNNELKGYHSGTDFRAKVGTPIMASNDGKVAMAKDRFYSGGTILIDHGYGVYTCYFHMSQFDVKVGEMVKKGQIIGLSGKSGRVTGPHLHFGVRINATQVDPLQFISLVNTNLYKR